MLRVRRGAASAKRGARASFWRSHIPLQAWRPDCDVMLGVLRTSGSLYVGRNQAGELVAQSPEKLGVTDVHSWLGRLTELSAMCTGKWSKEVAAVFHTSSSAA